ncbi:MAG: hypothetical protein AB7U61_15590 [Methylocystis sp.]
MFDTAHGSFATKPPLAFEMIERAISVNALLSFVAANGVYGVCDIELALRRAGKDYVFGVKSNKTFHSWSRSKRIAEAARESPFASAGVRLAAIVGRRWNKMSVFV